MEKRDVYKFGLESMGKFVYMCGGNFDYIIHEFYGKKCSESIKKKEKEPNDRY